MKNYGKISAAHFDLGAKIGICVERNGEKRTVKIPNPFRDEIDAEWAAAHPEHEFQRRDGVEGAADQRAF